jgi:hypothetical protein
MKRSCIHCNHRKVCGIYDKLFDAVIYMDEFQNNEVLNEGYDEGLFWSLAGDCKQFKMEDENE